MLALQPLYVALANLESDATAENSGSAAARHWSDKHEQPCDEELTSAKQAVVKLRAGLHEESILEQYLQNKQETADLIVLRLLTSESQCFIVQSQAPTLTWQV